MYIYIWPVQLNTPTGSLQRCKNPYTSCVLDMTQNHLMVRLQSLIFEKHGANLHCHCSQLHSDPEW